MSRKDSRTFSINDRKVCILHNENGTRIFNIFRTVQLDVEELMRKTKKSLGNQKEWQLTQITDIYNDLIENSELVLMVQYILSSSVLTLNILNHTKEEIELNNQALHRLERFISLVDLISSYHKDKNAFLGKWKFFFDIATILINFKNIYHLNRHHICMDLYPRNEEREIFMRKDLILDQLFSLIQI